MSGGLARRNSAVVTCRAGLRHIAVVKQGGRPGHGRVAGFALLAGDYMIDRFAGRGPAVVAEDAGLGHLRVIHTHYFLPVVGIVATLTGTRRGNMILRLEGGIEQAVGHVTQLAFPGCTREHPPLVTAVALQVLVGTAQFEPGGKMVKPGTLGPGDAG